MMDKAELTPDERDTYQWQMWVPGVGEIGQQKLKSSSVLISRVGGLGGLVAYELAAAGVGRLILAHAGEIKPSDLNRQLLMTHGGVGTSRVESAARRLKELNPRIDVVTVAENVNTHNAASLIEQADIVVDAAPLFEERLAMNAECVRQRKPLVEAAMYEFTIQLTTILPGHTACLSCRVPEVPHDWQREFPVFGAVSGVAGCMAAVEVIKLVCGIGEPLTNKLLVCDLRSLRFRTLPLRKRVGCSVCDGASHIV